LFDIRRRKRRRRKINFFVYISKRAKETFDRGKGGNGKGKIGKILCEREERERIL